MCAFRILAMVTLLLAACAPAAPTPEQADAAVKKYLATAAHEDEDTKEEGRAIGDLNGDGKAEITLVWTLLGPTYWRANLAVLAWKSGEYVPVAKFALNGIAGVPALSPSGTITIPQTVYAANDAICCPSIKAEKYYAWNGADKIFEQKR